MANRYFKLEEAQGYVSWLVEKFEAIESLRSKISELKENIQNLQSGINLNGGGSVIEQISNYSSERDDISKLVDENIQSIHEKGILLKSIEHALVDFPSIREGREVYLCWHSGEEEIRYWHEINVGFSGRQEL